MSDDLTLENRGGALHNQHVILSDAVTSYFDHLSNGTGPPTLQSDTLLAIAAIKKFHEGLRRGTAAVLAANDLATSLLNEALVAHEQNTAECSRLVVEGAKSRDELARYLEARLEVDSQYPATSAEPLWPLSNKQFWSTELSSIDEESLRIPQVIEKIARSLANAKTDGANRGEHLDNTFELLTILEMRKFRRSQAMSLLEEKVESLERKAKSQQETAEFSSSVAEKLQRARRIVRYCEEFDGELQKLTDAAHEVDADSRGSGAASNSNETTQTLPSNVRSINDRLLSSQYSRYTSCEALH